MKTGHLTAILNAADSSKAQKSKTCTASTRKCYCLMGCRLFRL